MMASEAVQFQWQVNKEGYEWRRAPMSEKERQLLFARAFPDHQPDPASQEWLGLLMSDRDSKSSLPWMLHGLPLDQACRLSEYETTPHEPLKTNPKLSLEFAETKLTQEGVLKFAKEYGFLGIGAGIVIEETPWRICYGEPLDLWLREIASMEMVVNLWGNARKRSWLAEVFEWRDEAIYLKWKRKTNDEPVILHDRIGKDTDLEFYETLKETNGYQRAAQAFIYKRVKSALERFPVMSEVTWSPRWPMRKSQMSLHFYPTSLIAALWLQFAQLVSESQDFRACKVCGRWIVIGEHGRRSQAIYCSGAACKQKAYRKRKARGLKRRSKR